MKIDLRARDAAAAIEIVTQASELVRQVRSEVIADPISKKDQSPVTLADMAAQALAGSILMREFPDDAFVSEESSSALSGKMLERITEFLRPFAAGADPTLVKSWIDHGTQEPGRRFWTMDPIDGTKGFLRGDQYAVALALVEGDSVRIGVLGCPNLKNAVDTDGAGEGTLAIAVRGQGAWHKPLWKDGPWKQLRVSPHASMQEAVLLRSYENRHNDTPFMDRLIKKLALKHPPLLMDSLAKYLVLAAGGADLLFRIPSRKDPDRCECIWDQAAGTIMIEEAGGRVTDLHGKPLDYSAGRTLRRNYGVLLSNGLLHDQALRVLSEASAAR